MSLIQRLASTSTILIPNVQLREVIIGPLCEVPEAKVKDALRDYEDKISVVKARLAFKTFRVVRNLRGFPPIKLDHVHAV